MHVVVEPVDGSELERLITALLNATGVVHRLIDAIGPRPDGLDVIGIASERLQRALATIGDHHTDEELALVTGTLAQATLLVAGELGLEGVYQPAG
jgi:hypothetical protein